MAWKSSGSDRIKSYSLYKDLEAKYVQVQKEKEILQALIASKDRTIRHLAGELAASASSVPLETFSEVPEGQIDPMSQVIPADHQPPPSARPTSNAPPLGHSEMRPSRTSVANGEGKALGQSIRDRLSSGGKK